MTKINGGQWDLIHSPHYICQDENRCVGGLSACKTERDREREIKWFI